VETPSYTSERWIHDELLELLPKHLEVIYRDWREKKSVDPFVVAWPANEVPTEDGEMLAGPILCELPEDRQHWAEFFKAVVRRTDPFALLLVEQKKEEVVAVVESRYGTKSWHYSIEQHGLETALSRPTTKVDEISIGVLWRAKRATA
jgi:hypothetical protein